MTHPPTGEHRPLALTVERTDARAWTEEDFAEMFSEGFPAFIVADKLAKQYIGRVREMFADLNLLLLDEHETPVATGWAIPIRWDGTVGDLPSGYTDATIRAVRGRERGVAADTVVICGAVVSPALTGRGVAAQLLNALILAGAAGGLARAIAPVRPTLKCAYPLTGIETFMGWTRADGSALDPWIRTHLRMGARILGGAPQSQTMTGTVAEWEQWSGMALPASGDYVIPQGLSVLRVDREADLGTYVEPNVWIRHR